MGQHRGPQIGVVSSSSIKTDSSLDVCHRPTELCARLDTARGPIVTSCWRPPEVESPSIQVSHGNVRQAPLACEEESDHKQPEGEETQKKEHDLVLVQRQFIALVKLNKWQSFYLAAMMYTVINMAFIGHQLIDNNAYRESDSCFRPMVYLLVLPLLASTLVLAALLIMAKPLHFSGLPGAHHHWRNPMLGLLVVLLTFQVPGLASLHLNKEQCATTELTQPNPLVLLYMVPALLEGWPHLEQVSLVILCLLSSMLHLGVELKTGTLEKYLLSASLIVVCLILGLLRRRQFTHCILNRPFSDAAHLVEAKASLEHQRQQQETLLLSVLPAYVAEQVKRNMVKKIENEPLDQQQLKVAHPASPAAVSNHHFLVDTVPGVDARCLETGSNHLTAECGTARLAKQGRSCSITSFPFASASTPQQDPSTVKRSSGGSFLWSRLPAVGELLSSSRQHDPPPPPPDPPMGSSTLPEVHIPAGPQPEPQIQHGGPHNQPTSSHVSPLSGAAMPAAHARRGFNELYIRTYNNVSLLYGDIVGFTKLSTKLSSSQLVRLLNDLFSQFDHLADRHRIMRIKILGDCYYGVSGIPEFAVTGSKSPRSAAANKDHRSTCTTDNHAINCVNMGLDMIQYIWQLNAQRRQQPATAPPETETELAADASGQQPMPAFELNMRIGIHTGHIHSGVIGLKKWQFDVWSNDVSIAIHCESSGVAGRVQVTQATAKQLDNVFTLEPASGCHRDPFLSARDIKTFLIKGRARSLLEEPTGSSSGSSAHFTTTHPHISLNNKHLANTINGATSKQPDSSIAGSSPSDVNKIRVATIGTIRQTLLAPEPHDTTQEQDKGQRWSKLAFNYHDISAITVLFRDLSLASLYGGRALVCSLGELCYTLAILIPLAALFFLYLSGTGALVSTKQEEDEQQQHPGVHLVLISSLLLALCLLLFIIMWWRAGITRDSNQQPPVQASTASDSGQEITLNTPSRAAGSSASRLLARLMIHCNQLNRLFVAKGSQVRCYTSRIYLVVMILAQGHLLVSHLKVPHQLPAGTDGLNSTQSQPANLNLEKHQLTVILLLVSVDLSVDLLTYAAKVISLLGLLGLELLFLLFAWSSSSPQSSLPVASKVPKQVPPMETLVLVLILWALASARQVEFINKANFLWRNRINVDHEEIEYISGINKVLLENILPSHVVQYYLTHSNETQQTWPSSSSAYLRMSFSHMRNLGDELYHEQHDSVAVMFASIPHFYEFYDESDISKQGLGCIALLNEIICDFDKLLLKNKFSRIEKIKTIGSSYMAAAGLRPCQRSSSQINSNLAAASSPRSSIAPSSPSPREYQAGHGVDPTGSCLLGVQNAQEERKHAVSQLKVNLACIIQFADSLMSALNAINEQSFQVFKLRVGVHAGPVIAGVIGAQRPFYDIWGDCVNIASRMESLGEIGRIQVEEGIAKLLMESANADNYSIVLRGPIDVKGKGGMVTYFVDKKAHESGFGESLSPKRLNLSARSDPRRRQSIAVNHQTPPFYHAKSKLNPYGSFTDQRFVGNN